MDDLGEEMKHNTKRMRDALLQDVYVMQLMKKRMIEEDDENDESDLEPKWRISVCYGLK